MPGQAARFVIGSMLPGGLTTSSSSPWNAQSGTEPRPQPASAQAGRPSPAIGMAAAAYSSPYFARYSQAPKAPQDSPVT